jgi:hypothetical protein
MEEGKVSKIVRDSDVNYFVSNPGNELTTIYDIS